MKSINSSLTICLLLILSLIACQKEKYKGPDLSLNADVTIKSFAVDSVNGIVNDSSNTISVSVPFGYNRTVVTPAIIVADGATVSPSSGAVVDLSKAVVYQVINGNIYKNYTVTATEKKAILSFVVAGVTASIDELARTITALVPVGTSLTSLAPQIALAPGASITPASGTTVDFSNPVTYTVTSGTATVSYKVTVTTPEAVGFLGTAATLADLTDPDEKAAWTWLASANSQAKYISFGDLQSGAADLSKYTVLWWHEDETQDLPSVAFNSTVVTALKTYYANGGSFLLTSYGARYVEALGVVPTGKGPNNSFGDPRGNQSLEPNNAWGISFKGHESHPAFTGLTLTTDKLYATAYLLASGTYRLNHTAQWYIPDWGGYGTPDNWRAQTGGIDLGSTEWDENHTTVVTMAEFPKTTAHGGTITISAGCYDWYSEANPSNATDQPANADLPNIQKMTSNVLSYLSK